MEFFDLGNNSEEVYRDARVRQSPIYQQHMDKEEFAKIITNRPLRTSDHEEKINTRALPKHAKTYQLEEFEKNAMIIFNHENLEGLQRRIGTDKDVAALKETFSKFDFEIECHDDFKKVDVLTHLKKFSEKDFTDYGCVVVVVLTHGACNGLLRANDEGQFYGEWDIIQHFKARNKLTLVSKPIVLLIQACRGTLSTQGVAVRQNLRIHKDHEDEWEPYYLPLESDMLVVHSSYAGKPSFRPTNGSWFIQTLCSQINKLSETHDLVSILTEVQREVAVEKYYAENNRRTGEIDINKQMPVVTTALIRKLYLKKYKKEAIIKPITLFSTYEDTNTNNLALENSSANPCSCFLKHFDYMKRCLSNYVVENPKDRVAKGILQLAELDNGVDDEKIKARLVAISDYLESKKSKFHSYIHFYDESNVKDSVIESGTCGPFLTFSNWVNCSTNVLPWSVGICIGACVLYQLLKKKYFYP